MIKLATNILYQGKSPLDARDSFDTLLSMASYPDYSIDEGHITYCKETNKHYKFNVSNEVDALTGKWREFNSGSSDEKVKLSSLSAEANYLSDLIDNATIQIDSDNNVLYIAKIQGQTVSVAEINLLQGAASNIQEQINNLSKSMSMYGVFETKAKLLEESENITPTDGATAIIQIDETNENKQMTYIYIEKSSEWTPVSENSIKIRDFSIEPLNLENEVTGVLSDENISENIVRNEQLQNYLDKENFLSADNENAVKKADILSNMSVTVEELNQSVKNNHQHTNQTLLDNLTADGNGDKFLSDDGTYKDILVISDTEPENTNIKFWVDNKDATKLVLKIHDGLSWEEISSNGNNTGTVTDSSLAYAVTSNVEIGGIKNGAVMQAGMTFDEFVQKLLTKYYEPEVDFSVVPGNEYYETGTTQSNFVMKAIVKKMSNPISSIDFYVGNSKVYSLDTEDDATLSNGGTYSYTYTGEINKDTVFKAVVKDTEISVTKTFEVKFITPVYYGATPTVVPSNLLVLNKMLKPREDMTVSVISDNEYITFLYNSTYGKLTSILDENGFENIGDFHVSEEIFNNIGYYVYTTENKITCEKFKYTFKF